MLSLQKQTNNLVEYEDIARSKGYTRIAGIDEVGRGPLAGPVMACACIIPEGVFFTNVNDSKKLSSRQRESLFTEITSHPDVFYAYGLVSHTEIDQVNIYQATILAMLQAISGLKVQPDFLLVDGLQLPHPTIPCQKIIQGDCKSQSIAAASILAKVTRDRLMMEYDLKWPEYGFGAHKGYGTPQHIKALSIHGRCPIHRTTFNLKSNN